MGRRNAREAAFGEKTGGDCDYPASNHRLGGVRRKLGADRRRMAYFGPGVFLSRDGNSVDPAVEATGPMDSDRLLQARPKLK
jgi:hypothetical protein